MDNLPLLGKNAPGPDTLCIDCDGEHYFGPSGVVSVVLTNFMLTRRNLLLLGPDRGVNCALLMTELPGRRAVMVISSMRLSSHFNFYYNSIGL